MSSIALAILAENEHDLSQTLASLREAPSIGPLALFTARDAKLSAPTATVIKVGKHVWDSPTVAQLLNWFCESSAAYLCLLTRSGAMLPAASLRRMTETLRDSGAAMVYGDYSEVPATGPVRAHPLTDYQPGSVRDDFDCGPVWLIRKDSLHALKEELSRREGVLQCGALYDLRLRLAERGQLLHLPEPLAQIHINDERSLTQKMFDYVDPKNREVQCEMEQIVTAHLARIGARLTRPAAEPLAEDSPYPCRASVIIPVKNRVATIGDAVRSALAQELSGDFNVIVVDNHSTDGTSSLLQDLASGNQRLHHIIPSRFDLGIGGCWNEAIYAPQCGRIAVQLDSDDLYDGTRVLQRILDEFERAPYAMVIGSYTTVNFKLEPLPPGLIDHREWSDDNGFNNALRIAGLGAPRAYHVPTLRQFGFPNVSYGEDYAVVLRMCRTYRVGRIYDSLYWCRRWEGNTDNALSLETKNRYDVYKDRLRSLEIAARRHLNGKMG